MDHQAAVGAGFFAVIFVFGVIGIVVAIFLVYLSIEPWNVFLKIIVYSHLILFG